MRVAIRADSAEWIGSGHINRCLTIAKTLQSKGVYVKFFCRRLKGSIINVIQENGFDVEELLLNEPKAASSTEMFIDYLKVEKAIDASYMIRILAKEHEYDWLIVDHYALDIEWEQQLQKCVKSIFVIDDLANRKHHCHVLLDQNYHIDMNNRYLQLVPDFCEKLLGPSYLLLRPEFLKEGLGNRIRTGEIKRVLVFFGGNDATNETGKTLKAIKELAQNNLHFDIVVGSGNQFKQQIEYECSLLTQTTFHFQIDYMAELMDAADLAIGAGGATTWERCYLGLPALIVILSENQREGIEKLEKTGAFLNLGNYKDLNSRGIVKNLEYMIEHPYFVKEMSICAKNLIFTEKSDEKKDWIEIFFGK